MRFEHKDTPWIVAYYGNCNRVYAGRRAEFINGRTSKARQAQLDQLLAIDAQDIKDLEAVLISRGLLSGHSPVIF